jgi:hypothetical protein
MHYPLEEPMTAVAKLTAKGQTTAPGRPPKLLNIDVRIAYIMLLHDHH